MLGHGSVIPVIPKADIKPPISHRSLLSSPKVLFHISQRTCHLGPGGRRSPGTYVARAPRSAPPPPMGDRRWLDGCRPSGDWLPATVSAFHNHPRRYLVAFGLDLVLALPAIAFGQLTKLFEHSPHQGHRLSRRWYIERSYQHDFCSPIKRNRSKASTKAQQLRLCL